MTQTMAGTTDLVDFLSSIGIEVTKAGQEIQARCPVHLSRTGKVDNKPSFYINAESGLWLCYSCGGRGNLAQLITQVTGSINADGEALIAMMNHSVNQLSMPKWEKAPEADIRTYLQYSDVPKRYLESRDLTAEATRSYGVRWNDERKSWIIPIIDPNGHLLGWQEKGTDFVRNHPKGIKMRHTLFGIERFNAKTAILVESPLDVVRFASSFDGMQCLASFGATISDEQLSLLADVAHKVIIALDNDQAGVSSAKKIFKSMPLVRGGISWLHYDHTKAKDIGEMTDDEIEKAVSNASVVPWWM